MNSKVTEHENTLSRCEQIRIARYNVWRNLSNGVSTHSICQCGRKSCRGGGPCILCAEESLASLLGAKKAADYVNACRHVRNLEYEQDNAD